MPGLQAADRTAASERHCILAEAKPVAVTRSCRGWVGPVHLLVDLEDPKRRQLVCAPYPDKKQMKGGRSGSPTGRPEGIQHLFSPTSDGDGQRGRFWMAVRPMET